MSTKNRGFASMSPEKRREVASKGGKAAHEQGTAHQFTRDEGRAAGIKAGINKRARAAMILAGAAGAPATEDQTS